MTMENLKRHQNDTPMTQEQLDEFATMVHFTRALGVKLIRARKSEIVGQFSVTRALKNHLPNTHGGTIMLLGDALGAVGAHLNTPNGAAGTTIIESKTNFIEPAMDGDTLTGVSMPLSCGIRLSVWQTNITREDGVLFAVLT